MICKLAYLVPLMAMACAPAPMTRERATALCRDEAGLADGVQGRIRVGGGSGGASAGAKITLSNRIFNPQTAEDFMAECVSRRMTGAPTPTTGGVTIGGSV